MIDGFDPDKFRKVNKGKNGQDFDPGIQISRQFGSASSSDSSRVATAKTHQHIETIQMPGVPAYDNSEKQLLASLEQELGVL